MSVVSSMPPERQAASIADDARSPFNQAWRSGLLLGFVVLLLLILIVTGIGYLQLKADRARLYDITGLHMKKLELTQRMQLSARTRLALLQRIMLQRDPFARDESRMAYEAHGADFTQARQTLLALGLSKQERALLEEVRTTAQRAASIHQEIIDLAYADRLNEAIHLLIEQAIPTQDAVLSILSRIDRMTREAAQKAARQAESEYTLARNSLLLLSSAAIALGLLVAIMVYRKISEVSSQLEHMATHDALTGLPNRPLLRDRVDQAIARARREGSKVGVLFIDLDGFKGVNDSLGHAPGDALIQAVAARIRTAVRAEDTVARIGGDEFVVVAGGARSVDDLTHVAEKLVATLGQPFELGGQQAHIGCSIGISVYPEDGESADTLIGHADLAMYQAKEAGRGCYRLIDSAIQKSAAAT